MIVLDRQWRYVYVNRAAEQYVGIPRSRLLGRTIAEIFPEYVGSDAERTYRRVATGTTPLEIETLSVSKKAWVKQTIYPSASGVTIYFETSPSVGTSPRLFARARNGTAPCSNTAWTPCC